MVRLFEAAENTISDFETPSSTLTTDCRSEREGSIRMNNTNHARLQPIPDLQHDFRRIQ